MVLPVTVSAPNACPAGPRKTCSSWSTVILNYWLNWKIDLGFA